MEFTHDQQAGLTRIVTVFLAENANLNLSALRTHEQCYIGNVLDSLALLDTLGVFLGEHWQTLPCKALDLGTGGGFPLLPLAFMLPAWSFIGLDATAKKVEALNRMVGSLELHNVKTVCGRSETVAHTPDYRASCDLVLSRAVAPLATLLEYSVPLTKVHGHCVFWKSMHIADELRMSLSACDALSVSLVHTHRYALPGSWGERQLLIYQKKAETRSVYPRGVGIPKGKPL